MEEANLSLFVLSLASLLLGSFIVYKFIIANHKNKVNHNEYYTVLAVHVAKENEIGPIAFEHIFSTIHGVQDRLSLREKLRGVRHNQVSFEIASINKVIKFYIWVPKKLQNLVEGQIYAQYPNVEILEIKDYANLKPIEISKQPDGLTPTSSAKNLIPVNNLTTGRPEFEIYSQVKNAIGAELDLENPEIYPVKRYPQFEDKLTRIAVDPIAGLTACLAKLKTSGEQAWIQVIIEPLENKWKTVFVNCLRILNKGIFLKISALETIYTKIFTTRRKLYRRLFFPLYIILWFQGLGSGKSKKTSLQNDRSVSEDEDQLQEEMSRSHDRETSISAALDKVTKLMFKTTIRVLYIPQQKNLEENEIKIKEMASAFKQFTVPHVNGFILKNIETGPAIVEKYQARQLSKDNIVLNNEELATIYHLPSKFVATPNIYWVRSCKMEPPSDLPNEQNSGGEGLTVLGKTNYRNMHETFGIKTGDRRRHFYIIGKTGMGKSTLLENMLYSDIQQGRGVAVVDPHGDLADAVLNFVPSRRTNEVIIFDPSDVNYPVAFNMLENLDPALSSIVCSGLVGIFKKIYADSWGPRLEHFLRNTILALLEYPNSTMLGITRMLQDWNFRKKVVRKITDPIVKAFWTQEFEKMQDRQRIEAISPILNKVGQFLSSPIIRNIVGQPKSAIDLRFAMDKGKIVIVNLSKGKIGEDNSSLLGSMIITKFQLDAMSRANIPEAERRDFYLYVDEFQNFATDSFATILSEARKYRLNLTMANQYIAQMPDEVREAVFGNVGSILSFQVGPTDGEFLMTQFGGEDKITINDLTSLSKYTSYIKLLIDGMPTETFSIDTMPPPVLVDEDGRLDKIRQVARERYSKPREIVEDKINRWSKNNEDELESKEEGQKKFIAGTDKKKFIPPISQPINLNINNIAPEEIPIQKETPKIIEPKKPELPSTATTEPIKQNPARKPLQNNPNPTTRSQPNIAKPATAIKKPDNNHQNKKSAPQLNKPKNNQSKTPPHPPEQKSLF